MTDTTYTDIAAESFGLDDLITPNDLANQHPDVMSFSRIRYLLRDRHENGLAESGAVIQKDRRLLIVKPRFLRWLDHS